MVTRYRMTIGNGQSNTQLDEVLKNDKTYGKYKDKIVILDIKHSAPEFSRTIETAGDTDGGIITRTYRQKASVTVTFGIYIYDTADRMAVCDIIKSLASNVASVYTSDKPGKGLYNCVCEKYPDIDSARNWTDPLTMTFSAYSFPYWQNTGDYPTTKTITGKSTSLSVNIPGNAPYAYCFVDFVANGTIQSGKLYIDPTVTLGINGTYLYLNYPFKQGNRCVVDYDTNGNIRVSLFQTASSTSLTRILNYVLAKSNDKLLAKPGQSNKIEVNALVPIRATFSVRGAWL